MGVRAKDRFVLLFLAAVIGFGVIQTNHSPVFHYTGELCNTITAGLHFYWIPIVGTKDPRAVGATF